MTLSRDDLDAVEKRVKRATPGPWRAMVEGRDHTSGDSFIMTGLDGNRGADIYLTIDGRPATPDDLDFVAAARNDMLPLIEEVKRLRGSG